MNGNQVDSYNIGADTVYLDEYENCWTVSLILEDGTVHWSIDYSTESSARAEFERWRK